MNNSQVNLEAIIAVILDEIRQNRIFAAKLIRAASESMRSDSPSERATKPARASGRRNRRAPAAFDPFVVFKSDEPTLRAALKELTLEELRDIVSDYGMDNSRLATKWKDLERLQNFIVDTVKSRARKGAAFLSEDLVEARASDQNPECHSTINPDLVKIIVAWKEIEDWLNVILPSEELASLPANPSIALRLEALRRSPSVDAQIVEQISYLATLRNKAVHGMELDEITTRTFLSSAVELKSRISKIPTSH